MAHARRGDAKSHEPVIENRRARHDYEISETLEVGIRLTGTEIKSVRDGKVSLAEGYVRAELEPPRLELHAVHIAEYPNASTAHQHAPVRVRALLAHKREIRRLADRTREKGVTILPLRIYFSGGRAKLLIGVGIGRRQHDKRQSIASREAARDIERALSRRRG